MTFAWPDGFVRIPNEEWTTQPVETLALKYDTVEHHGWYKNLDATVEELRGYLRDGSVLVDYSGGTGILVDRLLKPDSKFGVVIVDASPKFLRLALEKFRGDPRLAFRWIRYLKHEKRLQFVDEVLSIKADAVVSTNAIHLYYDLLETLRAWIRILKPGAQAFVQSGNIRNPNAGPGEWIIDETVESIHKVALEIVRREYPQYIVTDTETMKQYDTLRRKYFLPVRPLSYYLDALETAGFTVLKVANRTIPARVDEWYEFLSVYHEGVLGWIGGAEKVEGRPASESAVNDRLKILRQAINRLFADRDTFDCCWTYITCCAR